MQLAVSGILWGVPILTLTLTLPPVAIAIIFLCGAVAGGVAMYIVWKKDKKKFI